MFWYFLLKINCLSKRKNDNICNLMVSTGQAIQLFAYGVKDWHTRHAVTPFYQSVQSEAVLL